MLSCGQRMGGIRTPGPTSQAPGCWLTLFGRLNPGDTPRSCLAEFCPKLHSFVIQEPCEFLQSIKCLVADAPCLQFFSHRSDASPQRHLALTNPEIQKLRCLLYTSPSP